MMENWDNMEYLTDAELECLIRETEQNGLVPAASDLKELILEALEQEEQAWAKTDLKVLKRSDERSKQEKVLEYKRYRFRVLTTVAAAVAVVFLLPKLEGLQIAETDFFKSIGQQEYVRQYKYETKEEALNDSGMLEEVLGGVNIFADNSRLNLFRE